MKGGTGKEPVSEKILVLSEKKSLKNFKKALLEKFIILFIQFLQSFLDRARKRDCISQGSCNSQVIKSKFQYTLFFFPDQNLQDSGGCYFRLKLY